MKIFADSVLLSGGEINFKDININRFLKCEITCRHIKQENVPVDNFAEYCVCQN